MEDFGERTEEASPRRLQEARQEGHVARSGDLAAALVLIGGVVIVAAGVIPVMSGFAILLRAALSDIPEATVLSTAHLHEWGEGALTAAATIALPLLLGVWLVAYASHFVQIGWLFAPAAVQPRMSRISPLAGWRRLVGLHSLVKSGMDAAKIVVVVAVVALALRANLDELLLLAHLEMGPGLRVFGGLLFDLAIGLALALVALGVADFAWQKWKHGRDLRMNRFEIREELKQSEGDPGTRRRRQRVQQQIAIQRLSSVVPRAHVIVTNREHISIAIQYDDRTMRAPRVVAKGQEHAALRIQRIAEEHGIPVLERKPLARALYKVTEVGHDVPPDHYRAIAEILATACRKEFARLIQT